MYCLQEATPIDVKAIQTVGDLIIAAKDGINGSNLSNNKSNYSYSSAAAAASKLIAVFPVLTSRTVSTETAMMVSKYIEQKGCIILQMALQQANISNAKSGIEYLQQFHKNLNVGGNGVDAMGDMINTMIDVRKSMSGNDESASLIQSMMQEASMEDFDDSYIYESDNSIKISAIQMKELMEMFADAEKYQVYDTKLNPVSINDYVVNESAGDYYVSVKPLYNFDEASNNSNTHKAYRKNNQYGNNAKLRQAEQKERDNDYARERRKKLDTRNDKDYAHSKSRQKEQERREDERYQQSIEDRQRQEEERRRQEEEREIELANRTARSHNVTFLKDQDIKKMNSAVPSLLIVKFYSKADARVATEFIIGVKSKVLGVNSDEILRRVANDNKDGKWFLNLMRTMTGELKKTDFLFGLSRTYEDLASTKKKGSMGDTWELLKTRAAAAKAAVKTHSQNNYSAITTVLLSQEDCDSLYREENIDLNNAGVAKHFMQSYNLLSVIIADDSTESLKVIFDDGDNYFEELSYRMLDRETDASYKKMINLIAQSR